MKRWKNLRRKQDKCLLKNICWEFVIFVMAGSYCSGHFTLFFIVCQPAARKPRRNQLLYRAETFPVCAAVLYMVFFSRHMILLTSQSVLIVGATLTQIICSLIFVSSMRWLQRSHDKIHQKDSLTLSLWAFLLKTGLRPTSDIFHNYNWLIYVKLTSLWNFWKIFSLSVLKTIN